MTTITPNVTVHLLRTAAAHVERTLSRVLEPLGVTPPQLELLQAIARAEGSGGGCGELGRQLAAPGPDITRMLDRLDTAGLVARRRDEKDRRVVHAVLTDKARELLAVAGPMVEEAESALFAGMSAETHEAVTRGLETIRQGCCGAHR